MMVVVDTLIKPTHFILVKYTFGPAQVENVFMKEIVRLHEVPKVIISDRDVKFTVALWKSLFGGMGTKMNFSTTYHPQTNGQIERTNQILEDML